MVLQKLLRLALAAFVLASCSGEIDDGYTWYKTGNGIPAKEVMWIQAPGCMENFDIYGLKCQASLHEYCFNFAASFTLRGCTFYGGDGGICVVYSVFTEQQAKHDYVNGRSHYDHEVGPKDNLKVGHCNSNNHTQPHPRTV